MTHFNRRCAASQVMFLGFLAALFVLDAAPARAVPAITSVGPTPAARGEEVVLRGRSFGPRVGTVNYIVAVGPENVALVSRARAIPRDHILAWSLSSIRFRVPETMVDGGYELSVTSGFGGAESAWFDRLMISGPPEAELAPLRVFPEIDGYAPTRAKRGGTVTVRGHGFGGPEAAKTLRYISPSTAPGFSIGSFILSATHAIPRDHILSWEDTAIRFRVPRAMEDGLYDFAIVRGDRIECGWRSGLEIAGPPRVVEREEGFPGFQERKKPLQEPKPASPW